ncbi:hypothetical protein [Thioclava kandeliae]|uniref:Uncharacterized protein n=1 Tax=Thioclava kandeliae TaxID=3070818 RepID=A0ABV1SLD2_9RHOB
MAVPKNCIRIHGEDIIVYSCGDGRIIHHREFLHAMVDSRSLAKVKAAFPASRRNLLEVLSAFGFDFDQLLAEQFSEGLTNTRLAELHGVDAKWIAKKRGNLGQASLPGRPAVDIPDEAVIDAYASAGSYAGAARVLKLGSQTFRRLYLLAASRTGQKADGEREG